MKTIAEIRAAAIAEHTQRLQVLERIDLRRSGFVPDARPKVKDTSFQTHFRQTDGATVWLSFSSSVCKRVQVGTRTVEEPIYEVQCEEPTPVPVTSGDPDAEMLF